MHSVRFGKCRMFCRISLRLLFLAGALAVSPAVVGADPIRLDQAAIPSACCLSFGTAVIPLQSVSQTFTAGAAGLLKSVEVSIFQDPGTTGDIVFRLLTNPLDFGTALFSTTIPLTMVPVGSGEFVSVDVSAAHVAMAAGDQLAIGLSRPIGAQNRPWVIWNNAAYDRGSMFTTLTGGPDAFLDVAFKTNVAPTPEPSMLVLVATGMTAAAWARRRTAKRDNTSPGRCARAGCRPSVPGLQKSE
jgi:hypothetical protein